MNISDPPQLPQASPSQKRWFIYGWVLWGILLVLSLSACASRPEQKFSTAAPETVQPAATADLGTTIIPETVPVSNIPAESATKLGFKVAGWT